MFLYYCYSYTGYRGAGFGFNVGNYMYEIYKVLDIRHKNKNVLVLFVFSHIYCIWWFSAYTARSQQHFQNNMTTPSEHRVDLKHIAFPIYQSCSYRLLNVCNIFCPARPITNQGKYNKNTHTRTYTRLGQLLNLNAPRRTIKTS